MDTIVNYVENMFRNLPKTSQLKKLKEEILANMEEKYHELKNSGKTENEAIGIVISEFGNIDELLEEFEVDNPNNQAELVPVMTETEVDDYLQSNKKSARIIGFGVGLCILAPIVLVTTATSEGVGNLIGLIPVFIFITIAVALFIYTGLKMEKYKYVEDGVELPSVTRLDIQQKNEDFQPTYVISLIIGVVILILAPVTLITIITVSEQFSGYGVAVLLAMVAIAVYLFVYFGMIKDSYKKLLRIGEYSKQQKEHNRVIGAVSAIVWPLAVCIFLISGFIFEAWGINWIIFPITGLLFSMFAGAYKILKTGEK